MGIKIIKSNEIELLGEGISRFNESPKCKIFLKDGIYYKFWCKPTFAFYILNGLNMEWQNPFTITPTSKFQSYRNARFNQLRNFEANKPLVNAYNIEVQKANTVFKNDFEIKSKINK
jgi:hypothetical protein